MSDSETEQAPDSTSLLDQPEGHDWFLVYLIWLAEHSVESGVILAIGGSLLSGSLVSGRRFIDSVTAGLEQGIFTGMSDSADAELLRKTMIDSIAGFKDVYPHEGIPDLSNFKPTYVHLINARLITGSGPAIPANGFAWRGKIKDIAGISPGQIT